MKIRDNWRELLTALMGGQERATVARRAKLGVTYLRDVLDRGAKPKLESAQKLSDALGVPLTDWFLHAEAVDKNVPLRETIGDPRILIPRIDLMPRDVPVSGTGQCGDNGAFEFNRGDAIDYVKRPPRLVGIKDAYALYVSGDSMWPWRKPGATVYVHPGQPPQIGDYVVIQIKATKAGDAPHAYIKLLEKRTSTEITVMQHNPEARLKFPVSKVVSMHRIVEWDELMSF